MKKSLTLLLFVWACTSLHAKPTFLGFRASDFWMNDSIHVVCVKDYILYSDTARSVGGATDKAGFEYTLEKARLFEVRHGNQKLKLYLEPGDSVWIDFEKRLLLETAVFYGKGAIKCHYMLSRQNRFDKNLEFITVPHKVRMLNEEQFSNLIDVNSSLREDFLKHYSKQTLLPDLFLRYVETEVRYSKAHELLRYPYLHRFFSGNDTFTVSKNYFKFLRKTDIEEPLLTGNSYEYANFLKDYLKHLAHQKKWGTFNEPDYYQVYEHSKTHLKNVEVKQFAMAYCLLALRPEENSKSFFSYYLDYFALFPKKTVYHALLEKKVDEFYRLNTGRAAPDFFLSDENNTMVSLSDFRKKHVYIDFWASWCLPCIKQFKYSEELKRKYGDDLVMIYISLDNKKEDWLKSLSTHKVEGIHLFAGGFSAKTIKDYGVGSLPRYFLIDPYGVFIDTDAPRPSDPALQSRLDLILSKQ